MTFECVPRPACPACGAEWDDGMVAIFEMALGLGCHCCYPIPPGELPDIVCHKCRKVLYSARDTPPPTREQPAGDLDMTPRE